MSASDLADVYTRRHVPSFPSVFGAFCLSSDEKERPASVSMLHSNDLTDASFSDVTMDDSNTDVVSPTPKYRWHRFIGWSGENDNKSDGILLRPGDWHRPVVGRFDFYPVFESTRVDTRPSSSYPVVVDSKKRVLQLSSRSTGEADLSECVQESISDEAIYNEALAAGRLEIGLDCISSVLINIGKSPGKTGEMRGSVAYCGGSTSLDYKKEARYREGAHPGRPVWYSTTRRVYIPADCTTISAESRDGPYPNLTAEDYKIDIYYIGLFYR